jgi:endonuclease/exonuclease/phosphatase family metal-dependent hydrolase
VQNMGGVAVVSRYPLRSMLGQRLSRSDGTGRGERMVRFAGAVVQSPAGPILAGSAHLKSGGSKGSREDEQRIAESEAINAALNTAAEAFPGAWRVIGGDMNLVGTRTPLETLARGADADGSDLAIAPAQVWGDTTFCTWSEAGNAFAPGRLDWILYSDSNAHSVEAFVLDTSRLQDGVLSRAGLLKGDSAEASDHMPVVVDLLPAK